MSGQRQILIVEDDALISMEMSERVADFGYAAMTAATIEAAQGLLAQTRFDAALLDANLAGVSSVPLGAQLVAHGVPVAFCTGYDDIKNLPAELIKAPILTKPVGDEALEATLKAMLG
jgi:DNA-binding response OmpR family regulator